MMVDFNLQQSSHRRWLLGLAATLLTLVTLLLARPALAQSDPHHHHGAAEAPVTTSAPVAVAAPTGLASPEAEAALIFHAALSGAKQNPSVVSRAAGYAVLALSADTTELSYRILLDQEIGQVTVAHIHRFSDNGVELPLTVGTGGTISGTITGVTPEQVTGLRTGAYYVNVHTEANPGGEIAGTVVLFAPPTGYSALLTGAGERPNPVETDALGVASFTRVSTATLEYQITISNSTAITLGHIHRGGIDLTGPPIHTLYNNATPLAELTPLTGTVELDHQGMVDLLTGHLYVNFHSAAHPPGEIRGQIGGANLFGADLDGNQEVPPVDTLAYGRAVLALNADATQLVYRVMVEDLDDTITAGHIHRGGRGEEGPPEIFFPPFGDSRVITGTEAVTPEQIFRLISGHYYVNIHTATNGGGEIRGQVEPLNVEARYSALLNGANERPEPVATDGAGFVRFEFRPTINVLDYYLAVTDIDNLTAAHIHKATADSFKPSPEHSLYAQSDGPFGPGQPASGALIFDALDLVDLVTGYYYVNVHSTDHPSGEIRGQIGRVHPFVAHIDGAEEVPPQVTDAFGVGVLALNADVSQLAYRVFADGLDDISLAHIHTGKPGVNGPPDFNLFTGQGVFDAAHPVSGTLTLTDVHVLKLASGAYYINIHTAELNNAGVIRGQIEPFNPPGDLNALLNGANERPNPVVTTAAGVARIGYDVNANRLHYHLAVTNTTGITMAHIHRGPVDGAGGVVHNLFTPASQQFDNDHPLIGNVRFSHRDLVDLLSGWFYINVHTTSNLSGEIRGQIGGLRPYQSLLNGDNERPTPVETDATGAGVLVLSSDAGQLHYRVTVTNIVDITLAHIHIGGPEETGGPRFTLFPAGGSPFDPAHPISGVVTLTTSDLFNLAGGRFYINVHTAANGAGEIRGQVDPYRPFGRFQTLLTEGAEVSAAATEASGLAAFHLSEIPVVTLQYEVSVRDIPTVTVAHIHKGLPGESGPPVVDLVTEPGQLSPASPVSGAVALSAGQLLDLLTGYYYVNVHTVEDQDGQIRGQILVDSQVTELTLPLVSNQQAE